MPRHRQALRALPHSRALVTGLVLGTLDGEGACSCRRHSTGPGQWAPGAHRGFWRPGPGQSGCHSSFIQPTSARHCSSAVVLRVCTRTCSNSVTWEPLDMQVREPHSRPAGPEPLGVGPGTLCFHRPPHMLKFENHCAWSVCRQIRSSKFICSPKTCLKENLNLCNEYTVDP